MRQVSYKVKVSYTFQYNTLFCPQQELTKSAVMFLYLLENDQQELEKAP